MHAGTRKKKAASEAEKAYPFLMLSHGRSLVARSIFFLYVFVISHMGDVRSHSVSWAMYGHCGVRCMVHGVVSSKVAARNPRFHNVSVAALGAIMSR
jgi:hypothetical protein